MGKQRGGRQVSLKTTATKGTQMMSNRPCRVCGDIIYAGKCIRCEINKVSKTGQLPVMTPDQKLQSRKAVENLGITKEKAQNMKDGNIISSLFDKDDKDRRREEIMKKIMEEKKKMNETKSFIDSIEDELFVNHISDSISSSDYDKSTEIINSSVDDTFIDDIEAELDD